MTQRSKSEHELRKRTQALDETGGKLDDIKDRLMRIENAVEKGEQLAAADTAAASLNRAAIIGHKEEIETISDFIRRW